MDFPQPEGPRIARNSPGATSRSIPSSATTPVSKARRTARTSTRVPGEPRKFLIKRHELLYVEVTASNLVKVDMDDDLDESAGVNRPGFTLQITRVSISL